MVLSPSEASSTAGLRKARSDCWSPGMEVFPMKQTVDHLVADADFAGCIGGGCSVPQWCQDNEGVLLSGGCPWALKIVLRIEMVSVRIKFFVLLKHCSVSQKLTYHNQFFKIVVFLLLSSAACLMLIEQSTCKNHVVYCSAWHRWSAIRQKILCTLKRLLTLPIGTINEDGPEIVLSTSTTA